MSDTSSVETQQIDILIECLPENEKKQLEEEITKEKAQKKPIDETLKIQTKPITQKNKLTKSNSLGEFVDNFKIPVKIIDTGRIKQQDGLTPKEWADYFNENNVIEQGRKKSNSLNIKTNVFDTHKCLV